MLPILGPKLFDRYDLCARIVADFCGATGQRPGCGSRSSLLANDAATIVFYPNR